MAGEEIMMHRYLLDRLIEVERELVEVKRQNARMRSLLEEQRCEYQGYVEVIQAIDEALGFTEEE